MGNAQISHQNNKHKSLSLNTHATPYMRHQSMKQQRVRSISGCFLPLSIRQNNKKPVSSTPFCRLNKNMERKERPKIRRFYEKNQDTTHPQSQLTLLTPRQPQIYSLLAQKHSINMREQSIQVTEDSIQLGQVIKFNTTPQKLRSPYQDLPGYGQEKNNKYYLHRRIKLDSQEKLNKLSSIIDIIQCQSLYKDNHQLLRIVNLSKEITNNLCNKQYTLSILTEFSQLTLAEQIAARRECEESRYYFDIADCFKIIQCCIKGIVQVEHKLSDFQEKNQKMQIVYNRLFLHPSRICIMPDTGQIRLIHPLMVSPLDRQQRDYRCYYSPEKIMDFDFEEDQKCAVFELGMTLLHIISLKECHEDCYNGFEVMQDAINQRITQIWDIYDNQKQLNDPIGRRIVKKICGLLTKMTRTVRSSRIGIQKCLQVLQEIEIDYQLYCRQGKKLNSSYSQNWKQNQQNLNVIKDSSSIIHKKYINNEADGIENLKISLNQYDENLAYSGYDQSLVQSRIQFSQQKNVKTSIVIDKNIVENYDGNNSSSQKSQQKVRKEKIILDNGSSLYVANGQTSYLMNNIANLYNKSLLMGTSYMGLSDSFKYGNQLSEGIIKKQSCLPPKNHLTHQIIQQPSILQQSHFTNTQPANNKISTQRSNNNEDSKQNMNITNQEGSKFPRNRVQFNKNRHKYQHSPSHHHNSYRYQQQFNIDFVDNISS